MRMAGTMSAAVRPAATIILARAICQRGDGLDHEVDRGAVLDLGAERGRAHDECHQRHDRPDDEGIEHAIAFGCPPVTRTRRAMRTGRPASRTSRSRRRRLSRPRSVTATIAPMTVIGAPGS